jgi:hypothetical protein
MEQIRIPDVKWAQRVPHVFVTIDLQSVNPDEAVGIKRNNFSFFLVELTEDYLHFKGKGDIEQHDYEITLNFLGPIKVEE